MSRIFRVDRNLKENLFSLQNKDVNIIKILALSAERRKSFIIIGSIFTQ